jgi:hypothetical protein
MDEPNDPITRGRMLTLRIIVFAQTLGLVIFAVVVFFMVQNRRAAPMATETFSLVALALLAGLGTASVAFPHFALRQDLQRIARGEWRPPPGAASAYASDSAKLFAVYLRTLILGLALVEGAGIYCCVAYLLEGRQYVLALIGVALVLLIARFPTESGLRAWMGRQLDWLERQRSGAM